MTNKIEHQTVYLKDIINYYIKYKLANQNHLVANKLKISNVEHWLDLNKQEIIFQYLVKNND